MKKIGFTGTQAGMSERQRSILTAMLTHWAPNVEFHHGDCIGADAEAAKIAYNLGCKVVSHPPKNPSKRAFVFSHLSWPEKEYIQRNHDIVDETELLIATPKTSDEELRSGTWATIRYSKKVSKQRTIIVPNTP